MRAIEGELEAGGLTVGIAVSTFNQTVTEGLLAGALELLDEAGADDPIVVRVTGGFELPIVARELALRCDAVIALGAVIQGGTDHYEHIAHRASEGLMQVMLEANVPVTFGVLTTRDAESAIERSRPGAGNKGREAAEAAVRTANALLHLRHATS